jgi:hypothetical protein
LQIPEPKGVTALFGGFRSVTLCAQRFRAFSLLSIVREQSLIICKLRGGLLRFSSCPYGTGWVLIGTVTQGFTLGYFHILPDGRREEHESRWLAFVISDPSRKNKSVVPRGLPGGAPGSSVVGIENAKEGQATRPRRCSTLFTPIDPVPGCSLCRHRDRT